MNKTELQKDVLQIAGMVAKDGIEERVHNAQTSWYDWSREDKALKANVEKVFEIKLITLFYDMRRKFNRLATQDEYTTEYLKIAMNKIEKQDWYSVFKDGFIEKCVIWRADRAYKSNLVEITTAYQLQELGYSVFRELYIDYVAGVDLVAVKDNKVWYIHVTKDSTWAREKVLTKGSYRSYYVNYKAVNFQRDFEKHIELFYGDDSYNNIVNNGLPLFLNSYLQNKLDEYSSFNWDSSNQVLELLKSMKSAGAVTRKTEWISTDGKLTIK
ncbi:hypothetical protein [Pseudolactococcus carnosus]|uniref:hypothetical protein n=1 Tax=Pseudolactococcus carnosus TaxID=2749961 RepID=UPI001FBA386A|nr:hypothetical protein [Lactococcus carnosus]MCJ1972062.1 hypothetical protein [Lactococcus carnosus]MCJ2002272.1 hypothetical protein [Lactococcus carnosus]